MTPLDFIRNGIATGNWEQVCKGFQMLTGEAVEPPINPFMGDELADLDPLFETSKDKREKIKLKLPKAKNKPKKARKQGKPQPRDRKVRPSAEKVTATCKKCHEQAEIHPKYLLTSIEEHGESTNKYLCNKCMVTSKAKTI